MWIDQNEEVTSLSLHSPAVRSDSTSPPVRRVGWRAESWVHVVSYRRAALQLVSNWQGRSEVLTEAIQTFMCTHLCECVGEWVSAWLRGLLIRWRNWHVRPPRIRKRGHTETTIHTTMLLRKGICVVRLAENNVTTKQNTTLSWEYFNI
jgi:hypothetical protein